MLLPGFLVKLIYRTLVVAALAAAALAAGPPGGAQALPTVRVAGCVCDDLKTIHYGIKAGIFRRLGVNVEIVSVQNGSAAMASLVGGSSQVALTSAVPLLQGHARGVPFVIVAPAQWYLSESATAGTLLVKRDSSIQSGRDLNGKTIAVQSLRDLNWAGTMAWIDQTGGDSRTVKAVELPLPAVVAAIDEGRVDAGSVQTPFLEEGLASGKLRLLAKAYDAIGKRFEAAAYVSMADYVNANRDALSRFARGVHDANVYTNSPAHAAEMAELVASFTKMELAIVAKTPRTTDPEYLDAKTVATMQSLIDVAYKYKLIDKTFPAEELFSSVALRGP
jgi:NitT/TauT family transport system substrate-binding protein